MRNRSVIGLFFYCLTLFFQSACDQNKYYDLSFLKNSTLVREALAREGFKEVYFKASDGLMINGLFLSREHATSTVIVCGGWLPGKKEKMATFFALLPTTCNILLFDARGHGKSEGPLFRQIWKYGLHEYKDIVGAIAYAHKQNNLPIIICGVCSGAFNATHALLVLQKRGLLDKCKIAGMIFDSGWGSVLTVSRTVVIGHNEIPIIKFIKKITAIQNVSAIREYFIYKVLFYPMQCLVNILHRLTIAHMIRPYEPRTNLFDKIGTLTIPFLFIHSHSDYHANIKDAQHLASLAQNKQSWWINEGSYHACHHLKQKELYQRAIAHFIHSTIV